MAYEPLHHKYRPQTFEQLVGQGAIAQTLSNALTSGRIAPAYLFTGPRGTGKTSSSRILAKSLNCIQSERPTPQPCGECQVCREITTSRAMDIVEIDAASNTGVDNIREIIERAQFAPVQCRYKVYVIDECHMLSTAAFNALLKTLEEPPDRVVFVLATTDPQRVLNTIISRCQRFDFRRIPLQAMVEHLEMIAQTEAIAITPEALTLVAQIANGGLRDAESLLDQLSLADDAVTPEHVWDLVGAVPEQDLLTLLQAIKSNDPEATISQCRSMLDRGREPLIVLQNLATFYLNLLIAKTSPQRSDLVAVTAPTWESLCQLAPHWQIAEILQGQQQLKESESQLRNTTQPRLWLEVTLLGLLPSALAIAPTPPQAAPRSAPPQPLPTPPRPVTPPQPPVTPAAPPPTQQPAATTPTPPPAVSAAPDAPPPAEPVAPAAAIAQPPLSNDEQFQRRVQESWQRVLQAIEPPATRALVEQKCTLVDFDTEDGIATIGVASQPLLKLAEGRVPNIAAAFEQVWQQTVQVRLRVQKAAPPTNTTTRSPAAPTPQPAPASPPPFGETPPAEPQPAAPQTPFDTPPAPPPVEPKPLAAPHPFGGAATSSPTTPPVTEPAAFDPFASPPSSVPPPTNNGANPSAPSNEIPPSTTPTVATPPDLKDDSQESSNPVNVVSPSNGQGSDLTAIVQDFAAEFGEVIDFRTELNNPIS